MNELSLRTPGKINLYLEVRGERTDGYHDILTLFYPVAVLADLVTLRFDGSDRVRVNCEAPGVPAGGDNLAVRAAQKYFAARGQSCPGLEIIIEKHLPAAGGMGGGSSDAAAVLRLLQKHTAHPLDKETLAQVALSLGADVPFFLHPAPEIGRGKELSFVNLPSDLPLLILPGAFPVSTAWSYRQWRKTPDRSSSALDELIKKLQQCDFAAAGQYLRNDLAPAALDKFPLLAICSDLLRGSGGVPLLSGSGPTLFALYPDHALRDRAYDQLKPKLHQYNLALYQS